MRAVTLAQHTRTECRPLLMDDQHGISSHARTTINSASTTCQTLSRSLPTLRFVSVIELAAFANPCTDAGVTGASHEASRGGCPGTARRLRPNCMPLTAWLSRSL